MRVHGTIQVRPAEVFRVEEQPVLRPAPATPYDLPVYATAKVHRDHHIEVAKALYSIPGNLIGQRAVNGLTDRGKVHPAFYFRSKAFLHFYVGDDGIYADVRFDDAFEPRPAATPRQRQDLLSAVATSPRQIPVVAGDQCRGHPVVCRRAPGDVRTTIQFGCAEVLRRRSLLRLLHEGLGSIGGHDRPRGVGGSCDSIRAGPHAAQSGLAPPAREVRLIGF